MTDVSTTLTTLLLSHFPRSSSAIKALAQEPSPPSLSSTRDRTKSQRRFPTSHQYHVLNMPERHYPRARVVVEVGVEIKGDVLCCSDSTFCGTAASTSAR